MGDEAGRVGGVSFTRPMQIEQSRHTVLYSRKIGYTLSTRPSVRDYKYLYIELSSGC
jgi:hypothetical protein